MGRPRRIGRLAGCAALAMAVALGLHARAQDQQDQQSPLFRTGINFVRVDVIVSDRNGEIVANLTPADFDVTEDGKPQKIETFRLIKLDGNSTVSAGEPPHDIKTTDDEELEASREDARLFAIFLDDYHVRRDTSFRVREALARFVQNQLGPADLVGLMYPLQPVSSVLLTHNLESVVGGIQQFLGRKYDYRALNQFEEQYAHYPALMVEQIRNDVTFSAIDGLIIHLGSLKEGRKALVLVSEGFTNTLPPQLQDPDASAPGVDNPYRNDPLAGVNDPAAPTAQLFADSDIQLRLRDLIADANRYNVAIYAIDPRGLATSEFDVSQPAIDQSVDRNLLNSTMDTLKQLSDQTDGRAIVGRNDLEVGMKQVVRDTSAYYLIGYNSAQAPSDGKFHEIKVRVKRPGVQVRARKGYWAVTAEEKKNAILAKAPAPKVLDGVFASISPAAAAHTTIRTWIGTSRGENGKTKVDFVWEPAPKVAGDRSGAVPARVMLTAVGPDGAPYYRGRVTDRVAFEAAPGKIQLRMSIEDGASQVIDADSREVTVPDLTSSQPTLGTPEVLRARTVREYQQLKANPSALPVAAREFSRTDRLLVRVPAYGPAGAPMLSVHVLNRGGSPMVELPAQPSSEPDVQQIELPVASMAPGEYVLEIKAPGVDGAGATELLPFRVTS